MDTVKQKALEQELDSKFIIIYCGTEAFDIFRTISEIFRYFKFSEIVRIFKL